MGVFEYFFFLVFGFEEEEELIFKLICREKRQDFGV
jgi:hypothetical protein